MQPTMLEPQKMSIMDNIKGQISSKPMFALAIIIVLTILLIGVIVYYHGILFLGPYANSKPATSKVASTKRATDDETSDPETDKLINSINSAAGKS